MSFYPVQPLPDVNARQATMTVRPPSTSLLTIDSEDRFTTYAQASAAATRNPRDVNVTPYHFNISKNESLMNGFFTRVGVTEVNFPWAIPNINEKSNAIVVTWQVGAGDPISQTITLTNGFFTPHALGLALLGAINDIPALATAGFVYGEYGQPSFLYGAPAGTTIAFEPLPYNSVDYPWPETTKQLFHLLGMTDLNSILAAEGASGYTFCQWTRYVDIVCAQLTNNQALKDQTSQTVARDALCRLYLGDALISGNTEPLASSPDFCPPGCAPFTIHTQFATPKQIQWLPNQPISGFLQFNVYDDSGAPLTEILGAVAPTVPIQETVAYLDWSMTMMVSEN